MNAIAVAALFLPLFPLSMVFTTLYRRLPHPLARSVLLLAWPQVGLGLLPAPSAAGGWVGGWALASAGLYALRLLSVRELGIWTAQLAVALWALLRLLPPAEPAQLPPQALALSLPLVLLAWAAQHLVRRYGAAHADVPGGLGTGAPRLAGVLAVVVLCAVAVPPAAPFAVLLDAVEHVAPGVALALLLIALLWSWAGLRLLQGLLVGPPPRAPQRDLARPAVLLYALLVVACALLGVHLLGGLG